MEDRQIVELYWQKNADAISETSSKYGAYCFTIADHILNNAEDSEECVNDTWLHAWNAMPPQKPNVLRMFLAKITRNLSVNRFNARSAEKRGGGEIILVLLHLQETLPDSLHHALYQTQPSGGRCSVCHPVSSEHCRFLLGNSSPYQCGPAEKKSIPPP